MNIVPTRGTRVGLALLPFLLIVLVYIVGSAERRAVNPNDKILPPISEMAASVKRLAFEPDPRNGQYVLWADTASSLQRLLIGLGIATAIGLTLGLALGVLPIVDAAFRPVVAAICLIPPMAMLPILFIVFGLGDL